MKEIKLLKQSEYSHLFGEKNELGEYEYFPYVWELPFIPILVNDVYLDEYAVDAKYNLWYGGGSSAKSREKAIMFLFRAHTERKFRMIYCRKEAESIRGSTYQEFVDIINFYKLHDHFRIREKDMRITSVRTGNFMVARGLDNPDKLKGVPGLTDVWFEEPINQQGLQGANIERKDFEEMDRRLRQGKVHFHFTFNPMDKENWIYEDFFDPDTVRYTGEKVHILHTTYQNNYFNPTSIIETIENQRGNDRDIYMLGKWGKVKTGMEWTPNFEAGKHTGSVPFLDKPIAFPVHASYDFNVVPYMTLIAAQVVEHPDQKIQVRIFKEYTLGPPYNSSRYTTAFLVRDYLKPYRPDVFYYGDASGENRIPGISEKDGSAMRAFNEVREALQGYLSNLSARVIKRNPSQIKARDAMNDIFAGKHKNIEIIIDDSCKNLISDLQNLKNGVNGILKEYSKNNLGERYEKYGHAYSALVYLLARIFPHLFY